MAQQSAPKTIRLTSVDQAIQVEQFGQRVTNCARCGEDHAQVEFKKFQIPFVDSAGTEYSHWGRCPTNGDPILLTFKSSD